MSENLSKEESIENKERKEIETKTILTEVIVKQEEEDYSNEDNATLSEPQG